jgi:hypothetical protein
MNCEQVKELLSAYLDAALAPPERREVADHLLTCSECSQVLIDFQYFDSLLTQLPRVSPDRSLRERIFSSSEYLELTGTFGTSSRVDEPTVPYWRVGRGDSARPQLIALRGGRSASPSSDTPTRYAPALEPFGRRRSARGRGILIMRLAIAAALLLTFGIGGLIGWNLWHLQRSTASTTGAITPPAGLQQGPLPAGTRFVFLRDGALWSAPTDGSGGIARLTPPGVIVAENWVVRGALPGHTAGNMLAYIDLQHGFVHTLRSDGQNDTVLKQPLLKSGVSPESVWDTDTGASILDSLSWSPDGSMLAFVADSAGTGSPGLYIYSIGTGAVHAVPLPMQGSVSHPVWSPDGVRIAFEFTHNGKTGILDYNTQNHGLLTIVSSVAAAANPSDTVLTLDWSGSTEAPAITWSVGNAGHVHSLWFQRVGDDMVKPRMLAAGDYSSAVYSRAGNQGLGAWLLVISHMGAAGDLISVNLNGAVLHLTQGKQVSDVQWSPNAQFVDYLDALSSGAGALHILNMATGVDTLIAMGANDTPAPAWSPDSQRLIYGAGAHVLIVAMQAIKASQPLRIQGPASAFSWSVASSSQLVLSVGDGQEGIYLVDTQHDTLLQLDKDDAGGPILWTQIP